MNKTKRLLSFIISVILIFVMSIPTLAANITITGGAEGSEYQAYRLLNVTIGTTSDNKTTYSYTINENYRTILQNVTSKETDKEILDYIAALEGTSIQSFADNVYKAILTDKSISPDKTSSENVFSNVEQGYYLIAEVKTGSEGDSYSLVMLDTAGKTDINVATKENVPEFTKKVKEKNDSTGNETGWQDAADYDIGDSVPFQLKGTVADDYDSYTSYYYAFHDKMSDGLELNVDSIEVKIDNKVLNEKDYTVKINGFDDGCTFEVILTDLKTLTTEGVNVTKGSIITVDFTAKLTDAAKIGSEGNPNQARLEFSNNPYNTENKTFTPWDKVTVFTYQIIANKVDKTGASLQGAGFILYKWDKETEEYVQIGDEITGVTTFTFRGVDAGKYKLVENTVPNGYNKADDLEFEIRASYDSENSADPQLRSLKIYNLQGNLLSDPDDTNAIFTANMTTGSATTNVVNESGTTLPSTGGIGRTIFYIAGGTIMAAAAVLLITKRRMRNSEK